MCDQVGGGSDLGRRRRRHPEHQRENAHEGGAEVGARHLAHVDAAKKEDCVALVWGWVAAEVHTLQQLYRHDSVQRLQRCGVLCARIFYQRGHTA